MKTVTHRIDLIKKTAVSNINRVTVIYSKFKKRVAETLLKEISVAIPVELVSI